MPENPQHKIKISVPEQYKKIDEGIWTELEQYIYTGFLVTPALILNKTFVFKSLNHNEISQILLMKPLKKSASDLQANFQAQFIARSIYLIDGENFLINRHQHLIKLVRIIEKIPSDIQNDIIINLSILNNKAASLHPLAEIYSHENRSRFRWLYSNLRPINDPIYTGILGTDILGLNYCQQTWIAINQLLDKRERLESDWSNAKFVGSCFAGKGVRSIDERDRARKEKEKQDLEERKFKILKNYIAKTTGEKEEESIIRLPDGRKAVVESRFRADSVEELADQLSAALSGEKDKHDLAVERTQKKIQKRVEEIDQMKVTMYQAPVSIHHQDEQTSSAVILGGKEEAEARIRRFKEIQIQHYARMAQQDINKINQNSDKKDLIDDTDTDT